MISNDYSFHRVITLHALIKNEAKKNDNDKGEGEERRHSATFENRKNERKKNGFELSMRMNCMYTELSFCFPLSQRRLLTFFSADHVQKLINLNPH